MILTQQRRFCRIYPLHRIAYLLQLRFAKLSEYLVVYQEWSEMDTLVTNKTKQKIGLRTNHSDLISIRSENSESIRSNPVKKLIISNIKTYTAGTNCSYCLSFTNTSAIFFLNVLAENSFEIIWWFVPLRKN